MFNHPVWTLKVLPTACFNPSQTGPQRTSRSHLSAAGGQSSHCCTGKSQRSGGAVGGCLCWFQVPKSARVQQKGQVTLRKAALKKWFMELKKSTINSDHLPIWWWWKTINLHLTKATDGMEQATKVWGVFHLFGHKIEPLWALGVFVKNEDHCFCTMYHQIKNETIYIYTSTATHSRKATLLTPQ